MIAVKIDVGIEA